HRQTDPVLRASPRDEIRTILGYTVYAKGCPPSLAEVFLVKILMPRSDSLFQFLGEISRLVLGRRMSKDSISVLLACRYCRADRGNVQFIFDRAGGWRPNPSGRA